LRKQSRGEVNERAFFVASANEALFIWMALASRMREDRYPADRARLINLMEEVMPERALPSHDDANAEASRERPDVRK
jgi:hypothetical protein